LLSAAVLLTILSGGIGSAPSAVENHAPHQTNPRNPMNAHIFAYIMLALLSAAVLLTILSGPIVDWLSAREDRKKAAQAAAEAEGVESAAPKPA